MPNKIDDIFGSFDSDASAHPVIDSIFSNFDSPQQNISRPDDGLKPPVPGADTEADFERGRQIAAENKSLTGKAKEFAKDVGGTYGRKTVENFEAGREATASGGQDILSNKPASGVGKATFGLLGSIASPLTGAYDTAGEIAGKLTGNPEFGSRAAALPIGGAPLKATTQSVKAALPTNRAMKILTESIGEENLPEVVKRMETNPRLTVMDVSNSTLQRGQKLVVEPGPHQNQLAKFVDDQKKTANQTVDNIYSEVGKPVNVKEKLDELKANAKRVGEEQINPALAGAKPADISGVISHIDSKLKPGVQAVISAGEPLPSNAIQNRLSEIRNYLTDNKSVRSDPQTLHNFQSSLRAEASDLLSSSVGSERTLGREVMNVRQKLVDSIDTAAEGKYKPALSNFRDEKQIEEAFNKGADITSNRKGKTEDLPEFWEDWIGKAKEGELQAAKEGALTELRRQRATVKNAALKGENVPEIEYNLDKMKLLFGKDKAEKMASELRDERAIAVRNQKLYENSQTAMRLKADEDINVRKPHVNPLGLLPPALLEAGSVAYGGTPGLGLAAYGASKGVLYAINKTRKTLDEKKNVELTKLMTATGEERQAMLEHFRNKIIDNQSPRGNLVSKINALSRVIAP